MKKITFKCEVITPMFLAGADGKTPEFRAPSIKGAMRFWWRAMNGHLSLKELKKRESKIFGGSGENEGKSKVFIKILGYPQESDNYKYRPLPHSETKKFTFPAIKPGEKFELEIRLRENIQFSIKNLIILTSILGGLGKRARRGFGSFGIKSINNENFHFDYSIKNILEMLNTVTDNFEINANSIILKSKISSLINYPYLNEIEIGNENDSYDDLLKKIGESSHKYSIDSLGLAKGKKRLSSPIYVSVLKDSKSNKYLPIISTLNTVFENNSEIDKEGQNIFKGAIL